MSWHSTRTSILVRTSNIAETSIKLFELPYSSATRQTLRSKITPDAYGNSEGTHLCNR